VFLPQNRERIYLIGHSSESGFAQVFPFTENDSLFTKQKRANSTRLQAEYCYSTALKVNGQNQPESTYIQVPKHAATLTGGAHSGCLHSDMTVISYTRDKKV